MPLACWSRNTSAPKASSSARTDAATSALSPFQVLVTRPAAWNTVLEGDSALDFLVERAERSPAEFLASRVYG